MIDVLCVPDLAGSADTHGPVDDQDRQRMLERDAAGRTAGDPLFDPPPVPAVLPLEQERGQLDGMLESDASVAEGAAARLEEPPVGRVVQVDRVLVREQE